MAAVRAFHLLGVMTWIGGIVTAALVVALAEDPSRGATATAARRAALFVATPGMIVTWLAGLTILIPAFGSVYAGVPWMHAKLTAAVVATGLTGVLSGRIRRAGEENADPKVLRGLAIAVLLLATVVVFLVRLQPRFGA